MSKKYRSLSNKLIVDILVIAVSIFVLSLGFFYVQSRKLIHQEVSERSISIMNTGMQRVVNYMSAVQNAAKSNVWLLEEYFTPDSLQAISHRIVSVNRSVLSCTVGVEPGIFPQMGRYFSVFTVNDGDTIYTSREPDYEYFNKMWYKKARATGRACWINPFTDYAEAALDHNDAVASYSLPLHTRDGRIAGVVATDFSFSKLAKVLRNSDLSYPSAYYVMLGGDGRYLIHPNAKLLFKKTIFSDTYANDDADLIALGHEMTAGRSGTMHLTVGGENCHVCYEPVPGTDWSLALVVRSSEMMESYNHLAFVIGVIIVVGLLVILGLCYWVVRETVAPIGNLLEITEKIARGEYYEVIPVSNRNDAVAQLQNSFEAMQQSIISKLGHIGMVNQELGEPGEVLQEEKLKKAEEAIRRKNQFMSHVLSQIQRPLDAIRECSKELRFNHAIPDQVLTIIAEKMKYNSTLLHRMVLMLFDSSDTRAADKLMYKKGDKVQCNQLAHECIDYIGNQFPHVKMRFETEIPNGFFVQSNRLYMRQTITELLYNSAKYSDCQHILLRITETPTTVRFMIEDVGPGLKGDSIDMFFRPFMKVDDLSEGLGLGLPLCKRHAVSLGGDLIYDEDYHDGCRFFFELPK